MNSASVLVEMLDKGDYSTFIIELLLSVYPLILDVYLYALVQKSQLTQPIDQDLVAEINLFENQFISIYL